MESFEKFVDWKLISIFRSIDYYYKHKNVDTILFLTKNIMIKTLFNYS